MLREMDQRVPSAAQTTVVAVEERLLAEALEHPGVGLELTALDHVEDGTLLTFRVDAAAGGEALLLHDAHNLIMPSARKK